MSDRLTRAIALIDQANSADPNSENDEYGAPQPKELLYGKRMSELQEAFAPQASEHLKIAVRAQHIERWSSPRNDFPEGRAGYKKWRANLGLFHAQRAAEICVQVGYPQEDADRVQYIVQKRGLKRDTDSQALEDISCLVFLKYYLENFSNKHNEEKLIDIIQKTWAKMSDDAHTTALKVQLKPHLSKLVEKALAG